MALRVTLAAPLGWSVGVVIPARDEAATIERCVQSVLAARAACVLGRRFWVVVVADCCVDRTAQAARDALGPHGEVIECASGSPGTARRIGAQAVLGRFAASEPQRIWLANTDADTRVPSDWLQLHLELASEGATAVAGIVELDALTRTDESVMTFFRATYHIDGDGGHGHVHGANFGVRADAYLDVGGWSHVPLAEDHCLWGRLKQRGWRLCACAKSVVMTSARLHGRARGGFADTLRTGWEAQHG